MCTYIHSTTYIPRAMPEILGVAGHDGNVGKHFITRTLVLGREQAEEEGSGCSWCSPTLTDSRCSCALTHFISHRCLISRLRNMCAASTSLCTCEQVCRPTLQATHLAILRKCQKLSLAASMYQRSNRMLSVIAIQMALRICVNLVSPIIPALHCSSCVHLCRHASMLLKRDTVA